MHLQHVHLWSKYLTRLTTVRMHPFCNLNLQFAQNVYKNLNCWILSRRLIYVCKAYIIVLDGSPQTAKMQQIEGYAMLIWFITLRNFNKIVTCEFSEILQVWLILVTSIARPYKHINNVKSALLAFLQIKSTLTVNIHIYVVSRQMSLRM